jgi:phage tail-like protein
MNVWGSVNTVADFDVSAIAGAAASSAPSTGPGVPIDPALAHSFMVEIEGLFVAGFTEVSGLESRMALETIIEGGQNRYQEQRASGLTFPRLVLKRGITTTDMLWNWHNDVVTGTVVRRNGSVVLMTKDFTELWRWNFKDAIPVSWIGPVFRADQSAVAFETIELVHRGISKDIGASASLSLSAGISDAGSLL